MENLPGKFITAIPFNSRSVSLTCSCLCWPRDTKRTEFHWRTTTMPTKTVRAICVTSLCTWQSNNGYGSRAIWPKSTGLRTYKGQKQRTGNFLSSNINWLRFDMHKTPAQELGIFSDIHPDSHEITPCFFNKKFCNLSLSRIRKLPQK